MAWCLNECPIWTDWVCPCVCCRSLAGPCRSSRSSSSHACERDACPIDLCFADAVLVLINTIWTLLWARSRVRERRVRAWFLTQNGDRGAWSACCSVVMLMMVRWWIGGRLWLSHPSTPGRAHLSEGVKVKRGAANVCVCVCVWCDVMWWHNLCCMEHQRAGRVFCAYECVWT